MPTSNRRVATYIPKEIDDRFKSFKKDREISGDSQALIIILGEYFGVSQQVTYSSDSPLAKQIEELSSLVSELKSELSTKIGEERIDELKSELLSELKTSSSNSKPKSNSPKQLDIGGEISGTQQKVKKPRGRKKSTEYKDVASKPKDVANGIDILTTTQLAQRLGIERINTVSTAKSAAKKKNNPGDFTKWSKERDPEGYSWEFRSGSTLFYKVAHQSETLA
jgi:hypothetical protein